MKKLFYTVGCLFVVFGVGSLYFAFIAPFGMGWSGRSAGDVRMAIVYGLHSGILAILLGPLIISLSKYWFDENESTRDRLNLRIRGLSVIILIISLPFLLVMIFQVSDSVFAVVKGAPSSLMVVLWVSYLAAVIFVSLPAFACIVAAAGLTVRNQKVGSILSRIAVWFGCFWLVSLFLLPRFFSWLGFIWH